MDALFDGTVFVLGLAFGSFLNVCIARLPQGRSVVAPRSACPTCGVGIPWYDNLPVLSWLLLRGRCRSCRAAISFRYPVVELATALLFVAAVKANTMPLEAAKSAVLCSFCLVLAFTDLETRLLPDSLTITGLFAGVAFAPVTRVLGLYWDSQQRGPAPLHSLVEALLGAAVGAGFLYLVRAAYRLARGREGMGLGDVKLAAMFGAYLGPWLAALVIFLAAASALLIGIFLIGALYRRRWVRFRNTSRAWQSTTLALHHVRLPFGTLLAVSVIFCDFYGDQILIWYWSKF